MAAKFEVDEWDIAFAVGLLLFEAGMFAWAWQLGVASLGVVLIVVAYLGAHRHGAVERTRSTAGTASGVESDTSV